MDQPQQDLFVKTTLHYWETAIQRATTTFDGYNDADLLKEIAPGRNRVVYLLGHLTAVHDRMLPLLGLGERQYPQLDELFIGNPDKSGAVLPPAQELRSSWKKINELVTERLRSLKTEEWLQQHTTVSAEDFAREPHRNRLGVVLSRTGHLWSHLGQLALIKK